MTDCVFAMAVASWAISGLCCDGDLSVSFNVHMQGQTWNIITNKTHISRPYLDVVSSLFCSHKEMNFKV